MTARDGLVVSLPARAPRSVAERAVASRREWVECALAGVADRREALCAPAHDKLPSLVELASTGSVWPVVYEVVSGRQGASVRERDGALVVRTSGSAEESLAALRRWRDRAARDILPAACLDLARIESLPVPAHIAVRGQRTRWGSCSARGTVSLNRDLIFVPRPLVRYVLAHELVHLTHLDHSSRFWSALGTVCPDHEEARAQMRDVRSFVPVWADG